MQQVCVTTCTSLEPSATTSALVFEFLNLLIHFYLFLNSWSLRARQAMDVETLEGDPLKL